MASLLMIAATTLRRPRSRVARIALEHHEKFDGRGYPLGRKGRAEECEDGIHLYTRIVSIADVYSALLMKRVYKEAYDASQALLIMQKSTSDYDPIIFANFEKNVQKSLNRFEALEKKNTGKIIVVDPGLALGFIRQVPKFQHVYPDLLALKCGLLPFSFEKQRQPWLHCCDFHS